MKTITGASLAIVTEWLDCILITLRSADYQLFSNDPAMIFYAGKDVIR